MAREPGKERDSQEDISRATRWGRILGSFGRFDIAFSFGATLLLATALGYYGGSYLDRWLGSDPWLALAGFFLGLVAAFRILIRDLLPRTRESGEKKSGPVKRGNGEE